MTNIPINSGSGNRVVVPKEPKPQQPKKKRSRRILNVAMFLGALIAVALFAWAEVQRRDVAEKLEQTRNELEEIRRSTQNMSDEGVAEVLNSVRQLMHIPEDPEPVVATIIDIDALREGSDFYRLAENGDHLIITEDRAILFSATRNIILDVVPVSIDEEEVQSEPQSEPQPAQQPVQGLEDIREIEEVFLDDEE